jgi:integrase
MVICQRVKVEGKGWRYQTVEMGRGKKVGNLQPPFYSRVRQQWVKLGAQTVADAQKELQGVEVLEAAKRQGAIVETPKEGGLLKDRIADYLAFVEANKAPATLRKFTRSLKYFVQSAPPNVKDITRETMLNFKHALVKRGMNSRTVFSHFLDVQIFNKWHTKSKWPRIITELEKGDWPEKVNREPEAYTQNELTKLFAATEPSEANLEKMKNLKRSREEKLSMLRDENLILKSFLMSGMRSGELTNLVYGDVDKENSLWKIRKGKTKAAQRSIIIPKELTQKILDRQKAMYRSDRDLIFPSKTGKVWHKIHHVVQRVARRAGVTGRVDDHKFRSTAITLWILAGVNLYKIKGWVGHQHIKTLEYYKEKLSVLDPKTQAMATGPMMKFVSMGD